MTQSEGGQIVVNGAGRFDEAGARIIDRAPHAVLYLFEPALDLVVVIEFFIAGSHPEPAGRGGLQQPVDGRSQATARLHGRCVVKLPVGLPARLELHRERRTSRQEDVGKLLPQWQPLIATRGQALVLVQQFEGFRHDSPHEKAARRRRMEDRRAWPRSRLKPRNEQVTSVLAASAEDTVLGVYVPMD